MLSDLNILNMQNSAKSTSGRPPPGAKRDAMRRERLWGDGPDLRAASKDKIVPNRADGVAGHADELVGFAGFGWLRAGSGPSCLDDRDIEGAKCSTSAATARLQQRFI